MFFAETPSGIIFCLFLYILAKDLQIAADSMYEVLQVVENRHGN